jgi:hypothetical protein
MPRAMKCLRDGVRRAPLQRKEGARTECLGVFFPYFGRRGRAASARQRGRRFECSSVMILKGEAMAVDEVLKEFTKRSARIVPSGRTAVESGTVDRDTIRVRAHEIYVNRVASGKLGDAESDWRQAERELCGNAFTE